MADAVDELQPHARDLGGGFVVQRLLPAAARQAVGPFLFFDHFGPVEAGPEDNHDVRPHPHIGLATVTYLFEGAMVHRDSTGAVQRIEPGAINWMTAGRGIVHSERTPDDLRGRRRRSHGLQLWAALPQADEEMEPVFAHTPAAAIPAFEVGGARLRLLVGSAFGAESPVAVRSPTLFIDIAMVAGDALPLPPADERAIYLVHGDAQLDDRPLRPGTMVVLRPGDEPMLAADDDARAVLIGGAPLGPRRIWWNFVSTRRERIDQAADDWAAGRFATVPGETEFIPLPERRF
ncbi:MAG: pirin family protein [Burkholderiales bacterium]|nr:pirin family protein [Burkholderiales bacterium]